MSKTRHLSQITRVLSIIATGKLVDVIRRVGTSIPEAFHGEREEPIKTTINISPLLVVFRRIKCPKSAFFSASFRRISVCLCTRIKPNIKAGNLWKSKVLCETKFQNVSLTKIKQYSILGNL